jgi:hypothetical protein
VRVACLVATRPVDRAPPIRDPIPRHRREQAIRSDRRQPGSRRTSTPAPPRARRRIAAPAAMTARVSAATAPDRWRSPPSPRPRVRRCPVGSPRSSSRSDRSHSARLFRPPPPAATGGRLLHSRSRRRAQRCFSEVPGRSRCPQQRTMRACAHRAPPRRAGPVRNPLYHIEISRAWRENDVPASALC